MCAVYVDMNHSLTSFYLWLMRKAFVLFNPWFRCVVSQFFFYFQWFFGFVLTGTCCWLSADSWELEMHLKRFFLIWTWLEIEHVKNLLLRGFFKINSSKIGNLISLCQIKILKQFFTQKSRPGQNLQVQQLLRAR